MSKYKICFVSEANQPNYVEQFNNKINSLPDWFDFDYYVNTDSPESICSNYEKLKVFNLLDLQKRTPATLKYEELKVGCKLYTYPSNIRRHIINQGFEDGFDYVIWNDCDVSIKTNRERFLSHIENLTINTIYTQNSIYRYGVSSNQGPFQGCDAPLKHFDIEHKKDQMKIHDGPTAIYYLDPQTQKNYINCWDQVTQYGYEKPYSSHQKGAERPPCETYAVAMNDIDIKSLSVSHFAIKHDPSIKY